MSLNDYTKEDLKVLLSVIQFRAAWPCDTKEWCAMLIFTTDIEQAIKNKEFAEQLARRDQDFEANTNLTPIE